MKKKLNLDQLKVKSFVTTFDDKQDETIKGGRSEIVCSGSGVCICRTEDCKTQVACDLTNDCPKVPL